MGDPSQQIVVRPRPIIIPDQDAEGGLYPQRQLAVQRPMPREMRQYIDALSGPNERTPLVYDGNPQHSLEKLRGDVVSHYRTLCHALNEPERHDLTNPNYYGGTGAGFGMPLLPAPPGLNPDFPGSSVGSSLLGLPSFQSFPSASALGGLAGPSPWGFNQQRALLAARGGAPGPGPGSTSLLGYGDSLDSYSQAGLGRPGGSGVGLAAVPAYIPGSSLISSMALAAQGPAGNPVRVSSFAVQGQTPEGFAREESTLLYPPAGSTFEGRPSAHAAAARRGGIDTLSDFQFRRPRPLHVEGLDPMSDLVQPAMRPPALSERDQLDNFLSDYVNGKVQPQLPPAFTLARPARGASAF